MIINKINSQLKFLATIVMLLSIGVFILVGVAQNKNDLAELNGKIRLDISPSKSSYLLGEIVFLDFEAKNNSFEDVRVKGLDLDSRYITVYVAYEGEKFKQYKHTRVKDTVGGIFKSGTVKKSRSGILWNFSPLETSVVSAWEEYKKTHITTYYTFPKPGNYTIKAVLGIPNAEKPISVESEPIQLTIEEPVGEDLEVWNVIKDKNEIGFFIQESDFRSHAKPEEKENLIQEIERIVNRYPNSAIANQAKQSLEKFRIVEEKIKADMEKAKKFRKSDTLNKSQ